MSSCSKLTGGKGYHHKKNCKCPLCKKGGNDTLSDSLILEGNKDESMDEATLIEDKPMSEEEIKLSGGSNKRKYKKYNRKTRKNKQTKTKKTRKGRKKYSRRH